MDSAILSWLVEIEEFDSMGSKRHARGIYWKQQETRTLVRDGLVPRVVKGGEMLYTSPRAFPYGKAAAYCCTVIGRFAQPQIMHLIPPGASLQYVSASTSRRSLSLVKSHERLENAGDQFHDRIAFDERDEIYLSSLLATKTRAKLRRSAENRRTLVTSWETDAGLSE